MRAKYKRVLLKISGEALAGTNGFGLDEHTIAHISENIVVIFGCGTGNPFMSTDTAASLRAVETDSQVILLAKKVDAVYDSDPNINPDAKKYDVLSFSDILSKNLGVMDSTAASMCRDNNMPILVFGLSDPENIVRAVKGEKIGTLVNNEGKL